MTEGRYSLRPKVQLTPKSKISQRALANRLKQAPVLSPPPQSPTPPLPPQPDFTPTARSPDALQEFFEAGTASGDQTDALPVSDNELQPLEQPGSHSLIPDAAADVDYWLGPGASDDIDSMCVDADLSPDEDFVFSGVDEDLSSAADQGNVSAPTAEKHISPPTPLVHQASAEVVHSINPFPPLNPYPEYTFPPTIALDDPPNPFVGGPFFPATSTSAEPVRSNMDDADYDIPAEDEDPLFFPDSDVLGSGDDSAKDNSPRQGAGRIAKAHWEALNAGFRKIDNLIDELANETGRTRENIVSLWRRSHAHECSRSVWNKYQRYFLENRRVERQRIGDPTANCKACWEGFKKLEPKWREILDTHDEMLTASDTRSTISSRTRKFDALVGKLQSLATNASEKDGFESMLVVCGNSIHEDTGLSHVFVSAGAENFIDQRLRFDDHTLSGMFRNHVCNKVSEGLETRFEMDSKSTATNNSRKSGQDEDSIQSVNEEGRSKSSGLSVAEGKVIIKAGFKDLLESYSLDLNFDEMPWARLAGVLAPAGLMIENWPRGVAFPSSKTAPPKAPGATTVRRRNTSQGIKDLGHPGIRVLAESFASETTRIRFVRASAELLTTSKIPIYVEGPPGPGSPAIIRRAFANGQTDSIKVKKHDASHTLPPVPEVIEISSSSPSSADISNPPRHHQSKRAKTPDSDDQPLKRARKRLTKKSKPLVSDSEEISDADDDREPAVVKKVKVAVKAPTKASKGKGKAVDVKSVRAPIEVDAEEEVEVAGMAALLVPATRKPVRLPPLTEASLSKAPPSTKLVPKPMHELAAAAQAMAAARARAAETTKSIKPTPCPVKKPTTTIWDSADPFLVKPSVGTGERHLQGPGQAPKVRVAVATPVTTIPAASTTSTNPKPSAFGPPRLPSTAPLRSPSQPPSKRNADNHKVMECPPASASASEERPAVELDEEQPNGTSVQGFQWPYNPYYPPYSYHPPPGWPYAPWNQERPAGPEVAPFPPPHPGMPYPPPPGYYPPGTHTKHAAKPAQGEPGPSRPT